MILANMFLLDRKNKMFRKIAIIIPMFLFCLGLDNCKSPEGPKSHLYRYNIEVIYSDVVGDFPNPQDSVELFYELIDPAVRGGLIRRG